MQVLEVDPAGALRLVTASGAVLLDDPSFGATPATQNGGGGLGTVALDQVLDHEFGRGLVRHGDLGLGAPIEHLGEVRVSVRRIPSGQVWVHVNAPFVVPLPEARRENLRVIVRGAGPESANVRAGRSRWTVVGVPVSCQIADADPGER